MVEPAAVNRVVEGSSPPPPAKVAKLIIRIVRDEQDTDRNNLYKNNGLYICSISLEAKRLLAKQGSPVRVWYVAPIR